MRWFLVCAVIPGLLLGALDADAKKKAKAKGKAPAKKSGPVDPAAGGDTTPPADDGAGGAPGGEGAASDGATPAAGEPAKPGTPAAAPATGKPGSAAPATAPPAAKPGAAATAAPAAPPSDGRRTRVAVLELASLGIASDEIESLERYLRNSIATIDTVELVSPVDVQIALRKPKNKEVAACGGGPKCAIQVGELVQADLVVFGSVGAMGDAFSLNLRAMEVASSKEKARQTTSLSGTRHQLIPEMRLAAFRLIAPDRIRGSLLIEIDIEGVEIEIDGQLVGVTPMQEEVKNLTPGAHLVVLKRPGYSQFQQEFEIKPFDTARLKLDLKKAQKEAPAAAP